MNTALADALEHLVPHDHIGLFYESPEEQFAAAVPYFRLGMERGEQCLYIAHENTVDTVLDALRTDGVDVDAALKSGALTVTTERNAYLKQGHFDPDWMIGYLKKATESAKAAGFQGLRATGEMTWALDESPGAERLMEYEAKLNRLIPASPFSGMCQYNRRRFSPEALLDAIRTHPRVILSGTVCDNAYYVPTDEFFTTEPPQLDLDQLLSAILERERTARPGRHPHVLTIESVTDETVFAFLTPFADGELPEAVAEEVARKIKRDPKLQRLLAAERAAKRALATRMTRHTASADLNRHIRAILFPDTNN